jgi:hypothetical protein
MRCFKDLLLHPIISEAISLQDAKKSKLSKRYSGAYFDKLDKVFNNKNRIISKINIDYSHINSPLMEKIDSFLSKVGYTIIDTESYIKGFAHSYKKNDDGSFKIDKKNPIRIGKLLQKHESDGEVEVTSRVDGKKTVKKVAGKPLLHEFKNDPIRASNGEFLLVISRHPYDVAGSSTDRSWTSCMDLGLSKIHYPKTAPKKGINSKYVSKDILEGTLVAYIVPSSELFRGKNGEEKVKLNKPLSRILIKPHKSDIGPVYTMGRTYGTQYPEFSREILKWISQELNNEITPDVKVFKNISLYNDGDTPVGFTFNTGNDIADKVMAELLEWNNEKYVGNQITYNTSTQNDGRQIGIEMQINFDFGKDIVKPFYYLDRVYGVDATIQSEFEKQIVQIFLKEFNLNRYLYPSLSFESTGTGINTEIELSISFDEEEKYINDDIISDSVYYSMEWLKHFDYKKLKNDLYTFCDNYNWDDHNKKVQLMINKNINQFKEFLEEYGKQTLSKNKDIFNIFKKPLSVEFFVNIPTTQINEYVKNLKLAHEQLLIVFSMIRDMNGKSPLSVRNDPDYKSTLEDLFYKWFLNKFNVDLSHFRSETFDVWNFRNILNVKKKNPSETGEWFDSILDIDNEQDKINRTITALIGYPNDIKI